MSNSRVGFAQALGTAGELRIRWRTADHVVIVVRGRVLMVAGVRVRVRAHGKTLREALESLWVQLEGRSLVDDRRRGE